MPNNIYKENDMENTATERAGRGGRGRFARYAIALGAASLGLATVAAIETPAGAASNKVTVSVVTVAKYGKILVNQAGLALYIDTKDKAPKHFACTGDCLTAWPPLVLPKGQATIAAPKGVTGLSTVVGPAGRQVTWKGHPLYTFIKDSKGVVKGQNVLKIWFVVQPRDHHRRLGRCHHDHDGRPDQHHLGNDEHDLEVVLGLGQCPRAVRNPPPNGGRRTC